MARFSINPYAGGVANTEHVSLETDAWEIRTKPNLQRVLASYKTGSGGRGVTKRVSILADQYAAVETQRTRSKINVHTVDLRFIDPQPIAVRKVPWRLLYISIGITLLMAMVSALHVMRPEISNRIGGIITLVSLGALTLMCYVSCYYRTIESWFFLSMHGRARVIIIAGRPGTIRRSQSCAADLATHIKLAQRQLKQTRQAYLRDEMREHARLFEQGIFSDEQYSAAKRRILSAHK